MNTGPKTLFEKIWQRHVVVGSGEPGPPLGLPETGLPEVLYVDLHLLHEVTSPQAFAELERRGLGVRRPGRTVATMDHSTPTVPGVGRSGLRVMDPRGADQLDRLETNCRRHGIPLFALGDERQGIVHVIGPELGLTQPGMTIVCGDSHTSTHGAFGALAFGIGTSEVAHVLATQCLLQRRPRTLEVRLLGRLNHGATAKDLILAIIARLGVDGGTGHVIEYTGQAIRELDMDGRMTVCNMSIEAGARAGLIAPDSTTFEYLAGRPYVDDTDWAGSVANWQELCTDPGASFDRSVEIDATRLEPMITWGTHPGMSMPITGVVPGPETFDPRNLPSVERAWRYMGVQPGQELLGRAIDVVFVGSCTNSRLTDLEAVASLMRGRRVAPGVKMMVVPGSVGIRKEAESRGLHEVFLAAGAEWRQAGCSMCLAMNGDRLRSGQLAVSTTNRNFEGRQGPGGRTILASPLTAAAAAVFGRIADPRELL